MMHHNISLIKAVVRDLALDLSGYRVLTEAASGAFAFSPVIALLAGAKVIAVGKDSNYGRLSEVEVQIRGMIDLLALDQTALLIGTKEELSSEFRDISLIANLGFVRPLDRTFLEGFKRGTVITYMCEAWEHRQADLNLKDCKELGIPVAGVNEEHPCVNCFQETGLIALKLLLDAKLPIYGSRLVVVSRDKFGEAIVNTLSSLVSAIAILKDFDDVEACQNAFQGGADIVIVADYMYEKSIIGSDGIIDPLWLKAINPNIIVVQYCGHNKIDDMKSARISYYPQTELEPVRMFETLAAVSNRAVIRLHGGGLKVGEMLLKGSRGYLHGIQLLQEMTV